MDFGGGVPEGGPGPHAALRRARYPSQLSGPATPVGAPLLSLPPVRSVAARPGPAPSRARSSVDRALASGAEGRRFESCRARHCNLFWQGQGEAVGVGSGRKPRRHKLPP